MLHRYTEGSVTGTEALSMHSQHNSTSSLAGLSYTYHPWKIDFDSCKKELEGINTLDSPPSSQEQLGKDNKCCFCFCYLNHKIKDK